MTALTDRFTPLLEDRRGGIDMLDRPAHTASLIVTVLVGFVTSVQAPATAQFNNITRALDWSGPLLGPLSMIYASAVTLTVMAATYLLLCLIWQRLRGSRQAGGSHSGPSS